MSLSAERPSSPRPTRAGRMALVAAAALAVAGTAACSSSSLEIGSELSLELDAPASVPLADSLVIQYDARGRSLLGLVVEYGDGTADSVAFVGSQSAGGRLAHKYSESGEYRVTGRVQDGVEGTTMADVTVSVTP